MAQQQTLPRWLRVAAVVLAALIVLKAADMVLGWAFPPKSDDRVLRSTETVTVRLNKPNISVIVRPSAQYMEGVDGMQARDLPFRTDGDGFLIGPEPAAGPVDITFLGGSTTVCMYVDEAKRFPARVSQLLRRADGSPARTQNGGLNINHTLHSTFNVITTVVPQKPRFVALMHNDFFLLAAAGSYWTGPTSQVFIRPKESLWNPLNAAKRLKELLIPNIWAMARDFLPRDIRRTLRFHPGDEFDAHRANAVPVDRINSDIYAALTGAVRYLQAWNIEPVLMTQFNRVDVDQEFVRRLYEKSPLTAMTWPEYVKAYKNANDIVRRVARENAVLLIDLDRKIPHSSKYIYDWEHVNDEGAELVARTIAAEIAGRYKEYRLAGP